MKKLIFTLLFALCGVNLWAQAPLKLGYQMLVLDPKVGTVLKTQDVDVKLEIRQGGAEGKVVYTLQKTVRTNKAGTWTLLPCNVILMVETDGGGTKSTIDAVTPCFSNGKLVLVSGGSAKIYTRQ